MALAQSTSAVASAMDGKQPAPLFVPSAEFLEATQRMLAQNMAPSSNGAAGCAVASSVDMLQGELQRMLDQVRGQMRFV